jgi:hypothetical protein
MLLWSGKWLFELGLADRGWEGVVDLAGDVAFQASDDLGFGEAFPRPSFDVSARPGVIAEPAENDDVEGVVCAAVAASIEPVPVGAAAAGGNRRSAAEMREGGFGFDPIEVVAGAGEHLASDLRSDTGQRQQGGAT